MDKKDLISNQMVKENRILHKTGSFGTGGGKAWLKTLVLVHKYNVISVLDYGCGKAKLGERIMKMKEEREDLRSAGNNLKCVLCHGKIRDEHPLLQTIEWYDYDPAVEVYSDLPKPADLVICRDVIEHIEHDKLDNVLSHIASLANTAVWFLIPRKPASKKLSDGRNAHLSQHTAEWWEERLSNHFEVTGTVVKGKDFDNVCIPKKTFKGF